VPAARSNERWPFDRADSVSEADCEKLSNLDIKPGTWLACGPLGTPARSARVPWLLVPQPPRMGRLLMVVTPMGRLTGHPMSQRSDSGALCDSVQVILYAAHLGCVHERFARAPSSHRRRAVLWGLSPASDLLVTIRCEAAV